MPTSSNEKRDVPATNSAPNPGDFPVGSLESRAAARAMLERRDTTAVVIMTGLPHTISGPPTVNLPDTVAYYLAPDDSIVEVICRGYAAGKFTAFIDQTWNDGSVYHGNYVVEDVADLQKFCRNSRRSWGEAEGRLLKIPPQGS